MKVFCRFRHRYILFRLLRATAHESLSHLLPIIRNSYKYMSLPTDDGTETGSLKLGLTGTIFAWMVWSIAIVTDFATIVLLTRLLTIFA